MTRSQAPRLALIALAAAVVVLGVIVLGGGSNPYRFRLVLDDAHGLRKGTSVRVGDIDAGTVRDVKIGKGDKVLVDVDLDHDQGPVGRDARVSISSLNLLGQRFLALDKGDIDQPAASGFTLGPDRVSVSTDLDQVLNTLDANTRARLGILMNEAGLALTGRQDDVSLLLGELPHTLPEITTLLRRITADNHSLADVVDAGDRFLARVNRQRTDLVGLFDSARETARTFATKRRQIDETLKQAPGMLRTTQALLSDVQQTSAPLGPAAHNLVATAAPLENTLAALKPFTKAADPVLDEARVVSPSLTTLASGATPVLRVAATTAGRLNRFSVSARPATSTLNDSVDNLIAILDNWSRALQYRDSLSHYFRGEPSITTNTVESLVDRLENQQAHRRRRSSLHAPAAVKAPPVASRPVLPSKKLTLPGVADIPKVVDDVVKRVNKRVTAVGQDVLGGHAEGDSSKDPGADDLLDFLLNP